MSGGTSDLDLDRLLKLRLVVARFGEMDLAKWWNTKGQLGRLGAAAPRRGFPRTRFAQARSGFVVAAHRCVDGFEPPGCVTLRRLPVAVEEAFDGRRGFFEKLESLSDSDLTEILRACELGIVRDLDVSDIHIEVIDILVNRVEAALGVAFFVACYSAFRKAPVGHALLGEMDVQGNIKPLRSLTETLQVAKGNGAKRALIPIENKRNFLDVSADIREHVDPVFFGGPKTAAMKVLGG